METLNFHCGFDQVSALQAQLAEAQQQLIHAQQEAAEGGASKRALSEELAAEKSKVTL